MMHLQHQLDALEAALLDGDSDTLMLVAQQLHADTQTLMQMWEGGGDTPPTRLTAYAQRLARLRAHLARLQALTKQQSAALLPHTPQVAVYNSQGFIPSAVSQPALPPT